MSYRHWLFVFCIWMVSSSNALAGELALHAVSDDDSTYYEYFSDGFFRMDLYSPTRPANQSFHAISNPSTIYNQNFDGFPQDRIFRFGSLTYDDSGLVGGTGTAPITGLTLGITTDPFNPSYVNLNRFTTNTLVDNKTGSVELSNGVPTSATLTAGIRFEVVKPLGATTTGYYQGMFTIAGSQFSLDVDGTQPFDTLFGNADLHLKWDLGGKLTSLPPYSKANGDYDLDGDVDTSDYALWRSTVGSEVDLAADGNGDGVIDGGDYTIWRNNRGSNPGSAAAAAVPEPAAMMLVGFVVVSAMAWPRRSGMVG